jgi:hypothetical protein
LYIDKDMTLQKQLEYIHREFLVDTQWVEDQLNDPKASIVEVDYDSGSRIEMEKERVKKTSTIFFAIVTVTALFAITLITASQHASAAIVHHKLATHHIGRTASQGTSSVHKVVALIPETHGATTAELLKIMKSTKSSVIGGMIVDGY